MADKKTIQEDKDFKHIVRVANTDLDGSKPICHALTKIKGVGNMFANLLCNIAKIDKSKKTGTLSDEEISKLDDIAKTPQGYDVPPWMMNRRRDPETGEDKHIVTSDLIFIKDNDIKMMKKIKSYKGMRHIFGLPARGQRTKSNFRKNKGKVSLGVRRRPGAKTGK